MNIVKTANGKRSLVLTKSEWQTIGKQAGWIKVPSNPNLISEARCLKMGLLRALTPSERALESRGVKPKPTPINPYVVYTCPGCHTQETIARELAAGKSPLKAPVCNNKSCNQYGKSMPCTSI